MACKWGLLATSQVLGWSSNSRYMSLQPGGCTFYISLHVPEAEVRRERWIFRISFEKVSFPNRNPSSLHKSLHPLSTQKRSLHTWIYVMFQEYSQDRTPSTVPNHKRPLIEIGPSFAKQHAAFRRSPGLIHSFPGEISIPVSLFFQSICPTQSVFFSVNFSKKNWSFAKKSVELLTFGGSFGKKNCAISFPTQTQKNPDRRGPVVGHCLRLGRLSGSQSIITLLLHQELHDASKKKSGGHNKALFCGGDGGWHSGGDGGVAFGGVQVPLALILR